MKRIFIDFDDTLAQFTEKFEELGGLKPVSLLEYSLFSYGLPEDKTLELIAAVDVDTVNLEPVPGAIAFLHDALRWKNTISLVTAKPIQYSLKVDTWLDRHELYGLIPVMHSPKGTNKISWLIDNGFDIDVLIEDHPMYLYNPPADVTVYLRITRHNEATIRRYLDRYSTFPPNVNVFKSFSELRQILHN